MDIDDDLEMYNVSVKAEAFYGFSISRDEICKAFGVDKPSEIDERDFDEYLGDLCSNSGPYEWSIDYWDY